MFGFLKRLFVTTDGSVVTTTSTAPDAGVPRRKTMSNALDVHGNMKVSTFKNAFRDAFGVDVRVYHGAKFADTDATLSSIRSGDSRGQSIAVHGRTKVGNVEKKFLEDLGIRIQIENRDGGLADNNLGLTELQREV